MRTVLVTKKWAFAEGVEANLFLNGAPMKQDGLEVDSFPPVMRDLSLIWQWISYQLLYQTATQLMGGVGIAQGKAMK